MLKIPNLPEALFLLGEEYYDRALSEREKNQNDKADADFRKALTIWENATTQPPHSLHVKHAWYFSGVAYRRYLRNSFHIEVMGKVVLLLRALSRRYPTKVSGQYGTYGSSRTRNTAIFSCALSGS